MVPGKSGSDGGEVVPVQRVDLGPFALLLQNRSQRVEGSDDVRMLPPLLLLVLLVAEQN